MVIGNGQKWISSPCCSNTGAIGSSVNSPWTKKEKKILLLAFSLMLPGFILFYMVYIYFFLLVAAELTL